MNNLKLTNGFIVAAQEVKKSDMIIRDGLIDMSGAELSYDKKVNLEGKYIVPGFVDIHFHGYNCFDFTFGQYHSETGTFDDSASAYTAGFERLRTTLPAFGVTGFYVATEAAPVKTLRNCYHNLKKHLAKKREPVGARLLGSLLEGTFISSDMSGAMNLDYIFKVSPEAFESIHDGGSIKLANVVPDFGDNSVDLTKYLTGKGVIVGAGHTNATGDQVSDSVKAGLKYCIHFTNGPTGGSYKPFNGGGAIEAVLRNDALYAELIADGYHVNPAYVRDIIERKGFDKIIGISDCVCVAGTELKKFEFGGIRGRVSDDGNYIALADNSGALYGSNLTMNKAFENTLNWLTSQMEGVWHRKHEPLTLQNALLGAVKMFSANPCKLMGLSADGVGTLEDKVRADLSVLDIKGADGHYKVEVDMTIVEGNIVYSKG